MSRLTRQEQFAVWILLAMLFAGGLGRWWLRRHPTPPTPASVPAAPSTASPS